MKRIEIVAIVDMRLIELGQQPDDWTLSVSNTGRDGSRLIMLGKIVSVGEIDYGMTGEHVVPADVTAAQMREIAGCGVLQILTGDMTGPSQ